MIISPPFLPERAAGQSESAWLDIAMAPPASRLPGTQAPEGSFPLSLQLAWHNGLHIQAPQAAGAYLPVRAVADGRIVFVHAPTAPNSDPDHPLNYNPFGASPPTAAWTSDGFMAIEHRTEIGAVQAVATEVVYYSVYMHLSQIANRARGATAPWSVGDTVYRKDVLGHPGQIYGHAGQLHFEVCCDAANLEKLVHRKPAWIDPSSPPAPTADGRRDSVFGSIHVYLPAGTPARSRQPSHHIQGADSATGGASAVTDHFPPDMLRVPHWVSISHDRGQATLRSHDRCGAPIGKPRHDSRDDYARGASGTAPQAAQRFEYELYAEAHARHASLDASTRALSSPSGWYELLRFGRNLGPDPLPPGAAHWRKIESTTGEVWADLNAAGTFKFSDADFPAVMGWNFFDDDGTPNDQRCDSMHIKALIRDPDAGNLRRMERLQLASRLGGAEVRAKLRRAVCKFPSEWERASVAARYGWLQTHDFKLGDDDAAAARKWERFVAHAHALSFESLPETLLKADWRFHPREFIEHMRQCGWRSPRELAQLIPAHVLRKPGSHRSPSAAVWESPSLAPAQRLLSAHAQALNRALRKYLISTPIRQACFFGNATQETQWLSHMKENNGRTPSLHAGWYGRGFLQLTNPQGNINGGNNNYYKYFRFLGRQPGVPPGTIEVGWRDAVADDPHHAADSAAAYWVWPDKSLPSARSPALPLVGNTNEYADLAADDLNIRNVAATSQHGNKAWYYNQSFTNCAAAVNYPATVGQNPPNMNGLIDRSTAFTNALTVLMDVERFQDLHGMSQPVPDDFTKRVLP